MHATELLDEHLHPDEVRVEVLWSRPLEQLTEQYITYQPSLRLLWAYIRRVGLIAVVRKVRSRLGESSRNQKSAQFGAGMIVESLDDKIATGTNVLFFAPNAHPSARRVVVNKAFVQRTESLRSAPPSDISLPLELKEYLAWSRFSGKPVDEHTVTRGLERLARLTERLPPPSDQYAPLSSIEVRRTPKKAVNGKFEVGLFGLGHYAKHIVLPNLTRDFKLAGVHEIDPHQMVKLKHRGAVLDTSPDPRKNENYDLWLIAGYHHTHAGLATHALKLGSAVAVEKPIATTRDDLATLAEAIKGGQGRFFACFQRRYGRFSEWIREDLALSSEAKPVHYNCIAYDIPLSPLHWYSWPNSKSRIISNGYHWIDHFMMINGYADVRYAEAVRLGGEGVLALLVLSNGAELTLRLTESGSSRIGPREYVEISSACHTVTIRDSRFYEASDSSRVLRRAKVRPLEAYKRMYREICQRVASGGAGDSLDTLKSAEATILLDELL